MGEQWGLRAAAESVAVNMVVVGPTVAGSGWARQGRGTRRPRGEGKKREEEGDGTRGSGGHRLFTEPAVAAELFTEAAGTSEPSEELDMQVADPTLARSTVALPSAGSSASAAAARVALKAGGMPRPCRGIHKGRA